MRRCWFHVGEMEPCWRCARAHREQRAEDEALLAERRIHSLRAAAGKLGVIARTERPAPKPKRTHCARGHAFVGDRTRSRDCLACARERNAAAGLCTPLAVTLRCTFCGAEFVRTYPAQRRCEEHMRMKQRRHPERHASSRCAEAAE